MPHKAREVEARCLFCHRKRVCLEADPGGGEETIEICQECLSEVFDAGRERRNESLTCFLDRIEGERQAIADATGELQGIIDQISDDTNTQEEEIDAQRHHLNDVAYKLGNIISEIEAAISADKWPSAKEQME